MGSKITVCIEICRVQALNLQVTIVGSSGKDHAIGLMIHVILLQR